MSNIEVSNDRDPKSGQFLKGYKGGGRKPGSRAKLSEQFVSDLADAWQKHGIAALERCATESPDVFVRTIAGLMPKDIRIDATLDVTAFANNFRHALALLGNEAEPPRSRKPMKVINHNAG